ncbi:MAG: cytochrome b [Halioglobus sp.]|nr:cytochrome b [Halioglobus sp.]
MPTRYHPLLVALHWLIGIAVILALIAGIAGLEAMPNSDPEKVLALRIHMSMGIAIGLFMVLRLVTRLAAKSPPPAATGRSGLDRLARAVHVLLYLLVFAMVSTGLGTAATAGLFPIVFEGSGAPLPPDFSAYPPRAGHGFFAKLLIGLVLLHIAAALWHQFALRDGLMRRMWFGERN